MADFSIFQNSCSTLRMQRRNALHTAAFTTRLLKYRGCNKHRSRRLSPPSKLDPERLLDFLLQSVDSRRYCRIEKLPSSIA